MSAQPEIPAALVEHFAARAATRQREREALLAGMTERERLLVREAAIMGYVRGTMAGEIAVRDGLRRTEIPKDSDILHEVLAGCLSFPEIYRTITGWTPDEEDAQPCPARQAVAYFANYTMPPMESSLPCTLPRGHEGHHECQTPDGPYAFESAAL